MCVCVFEYWLSCRQYIDILLPTNSHYSILNVHHNQSNLGLDFELRHCEAFIDKQCLVENMALQYSGSNGVYFTEKRRKLAVNSRIKRITLSSSLVGKNRRRRLGPNGTSHTKRPLVVNIQINVTKQPPKYHSSYRLIWYLRHSFANWEVGI